MSQEIGNSHIWIPIDGAAIERGEMPPSDAPNAINLHDSLPLPSDETLQNVWDGAVEMVTEDPGGTITPLMLFNRGAEGGTIFWYMGYGSSARRSGGAREAVVLAALNPDMQIVAVDELVDVSPEVKLAGFMGDVEPYINAHVPHIEQMQRSKGIVPTVLAGRSKGGRLSTVLAGHDDMPDLDHVITADMPGAHYYASKLNFGLKIGYFEDQPKYKGPTLVGIDHEEERMLAGLDVPSVDSLTMPEKLMKGAREFWIVRGLGSIGLHEEFDKAMNEQAGAMFTNFHATGNLGMPLEANNAMIAELLKIHPDRLRAYIGHTRHFAEGHTPRFGRQVAHALRAE